MAIPKGDLGRSGQLCMERENWRRTASQISAHIAELRELIKRQTATLANCEAELESVKSEIAQIESEAKTEGIILDPPS